MWGVGEQVRGGPPSLRGNTTLYHLLSREPWGDADGPLSPSRPK